MSSGKKYFPINTDTSCALKWSWNTLQLYTGETSSCHRVDSDIVNIDNFDTFHNTPKKLTDRQLMLDGQWPTGGCEYCENVEKSGGSSDRQFHLKIPNTYPLELDVDNTQLVVNPTILEIYLDNVCNMSCLYCWDGFSSQIQQENIKHGPFEKAGVVIENRAVMHPESRTLRSKFWEWMEKNSHSLQRLHILGGEPFYQKDFETCLTFLESHAHPDLEFNIVSNLMINSNKFVRYIERIKQLIKSKKIGRFDLTASIDCFGEEQEYVRYGLRLDQWKQNFEYLVSEAWITVNINQTISALTIKTIPPLVEYINSLRTSRKIGHYMSTTVMTYGFLHPKIFGKGFYDKDFDAILALMPETTWQQKEAKKYLSGVRSYLNTCEYNQSAINQLTIYLDELDRRRGTNWHTTFPWLEKYVLQ
jgi:organic radical activating enzyme